MQPVRPACTPASSCCCLKPVSKFSLALMGAEQTLGTRPRDFHLLISKEGIWSFARRSWESTCPATRLLHWGLEERGLPFSRAQASGKRAWSQGDVTSARAGDEGIGSRWEVVLSPELVEACYRFWDFQNAGQLFIYLFISPPKAPAFVSVITVKRCVKTVVVSLPSRFVVVLAVGEIMKFSRKSELKYRNLKFSLAPLSPAFPETNPCKRVSTHGFGFSLLSFLCSSLACQALEVLGKKSGMDQLFNQSARVSGAIAFYYWPRDVFWCPKAW